MKPAQTRALATALCLVAFIAGCGSTDDPANTDPEYPYVEPIPLAGCEKQAFAVCDIRTPACQEQWASLVGCLRQAEGSVVVPVRTISEADFRSELSGDPGDAMPVPNLEYWDGGLSYFGLIEAGALVSDDVSDDYVSNVLAYYSIGDKDITVIDHGRRADAIIANSTLAHELVHAAQDSELDLEAFQTTYVVDDDTFLGTDAVIEGEARFYEVEVVAGLNGIALDSVDLGSVFTERSQMELEWSLTQPSPYLAADSSFPYGAGSRYAYLAHASGGADGIRALFADPPFTTRRVLLEDVEGADEPKEIDWGKDPAVEGFDLLFTGAFGAYGMLMLAGADNLEQSRELVAALRGDHFSVYGHDGQIASDVGVVWRFNLSEGGSAAALVNLAVAALGHAPASKTLDDGMGHLTLLAGSSGTVIQTLESAFAP